MFNNTNIKNLDPRLRAKLKIPVPIKEELDKELSEINENTVILKKELDNKDFTEVNKVVERLLESNKRLENKIDSYLKVRNEVDNINNEINKIQNQISHIVDILQTITIINNK